MLPQTAACRGAVRQLFSQSGQPIWITDDILANAFQRFLRVSHSNRKRHGSSVPGPLEARRRLAKRRMMGLATAGATSPDMGAIFGLRPPRQQDLKWEAPYPIEQPLEREPHATPLPSWLSDFQPPPVSSQAPADADNLASYKAGLANIGCLEDVRSLITDLSETERQTPTYSRLALDALRREMRKRTMPYGALVEFLKDPLLNHPEAENTNSVLMAITQTEFRDRNRKDQYPVLVGTIKQSLTLGTLMESEVYSILDNLPRVVRKVWYKPKHQARALCHAYRAIWEGMTACRIIQYSAVNGPLLRKLITNLCQVRPTSKSRALLLSELYQFAWPVNDDSRTTNMVEDMASWIHRLAVENAGGKLSPDWSSTRIRLKDILEVLPPNEAQYWINVVTGRLARTATAEEKASSALCMWLAFLRDSSLLQVYSRTDRPGWNGVYEILAAKGQPTMIADHFKTLTGCETGRILLKYWLPQYVPRQTEYTDGQETDLAAVAERFEAYLSQRPTEHTRMRQSFLCLILALHDCGQPYRVAMRHLLDLLWAMHGPRALLTPIRKFRRRNMQVDYKPLAAAIQKLSEEQSLPALRFALRLYRCSRVWLCTCPKLPLALIKANHHRTSIFKMLARHDPTNALPMYLRDTDANPLNQVRNKLVHHIAYAFAQHEQRSTRAAFRDVFFCYRYLRSRRAPLQPLLSKAFVRAGVIRPLQDMEWVSTVKFRFILKLVRELEGEDVAEELDKLVWQWRCRMVWEKRAAANPRWS